MITGILDLAAHAKFISEKKVLRLIDRVLLTGLPGANKNPTGGKYLATA